MAAKPETTSTKIGKSVQTALLTSPFLAGWGWCGNTVWPWLMQQAEFWREGKAFALPGTAEQCLALAGLMVVPVAWFVAYFALNVWREIERDQKIYKVTASKLASFPGAARDLCGRWWDAVAGRIGRLFSSFSFTRRYLRELPRLRKVLDVRNLVMTQANHLELEDVYIELKAASRTMGQRSVANPVTRELQNDRAAIWDHLRVLKPGVGLAIVGAPGSGKTTLLKHLMLKYAWNQQWQFRVRSRVPFFVELRKLPKLLGKGITLPDVLAKVLYAENDLKSLLAHMPGDWLARLLKQGRCLLLCDGLDEVPDAAARQKVSKWLDDQINHTDWRGNLFLVTARPAGYESAPLRQVQSLEVQPFDWEDTRSFIRRWYMANRVITMRATTPTRTIRDLASQDADSLLSKLRNHARLGVLTSNPLLLTMVCLMHEMGQLPGSRSQLYKEICEVHLERWRRRAGDAFGGEKPKRETWNAEQKLTILRPLAQHLMQCGDVPLNGVTSDSKRLTTDDMLKEAKAALDHIGVGADRDARKAFFTDLHNESGLWLELEPDEWGFAHLSFQEYLCADLWFTTPDSAPKEQDWTAYFEKSWWRECLLLYASKTTDLRPLVRAALAARTPRSLAFLFALEGETVTIPADLQTRVEVELNQALASRDPEIFTPAAEAWLLRQQEMGYARIDDTREISGWVTQAEYQLFLNTFGEYSDDIWLLHQFRQWFEGEPRSPSVGMRYSAAENYCNLLNHRFPEFHHHLAGEDLRQRVCSQMDDKWITWLEKGALSDPSEKLQLHLYSNKQQPNILALDLYLDRYLYLHFDLALGLYRDTDLGLGSDLYLARDCYLDLARALYLDRALNRDRDRGLDLDLALARALARALAFDRVLALAFDLDKEMSIDEWQRQDSLMVERCEQGRSTGERNQWKLARALFPLWSPETEVADSPGVFRRFLVTCIDAIRLSHPNRVIAELQPLEDVLRLLIDREEGRAPAWEGIRVVRERRV